MQFCSSLEVYFKTYFIIRVCKTELNIFYPLFLRELEFQKLLILIFKKISVMLNHSILCAISSKGLPLNVSLKNCLPLTFSDVTLLFWKQEYVSHETFLFISMWNELMLQRNKFFCICFLIYSPCNEIIKVPEKSWIDKYAF